MLWIAPIDPGDHCIDSITHGTFDLLHIGHLTVRVVRRVDPGGGISMITSLEDGKPSRVLAVAVRSGPLMI